MCWQSMSCQCVIGADGKGRPNEAFGRPLRMVWTAETCRKDGFCVCDMSEGVANGKVYGLPVLELRYVVEAALARLVRHVQADAPVEAQHEEV